jgi:acyl-coenzyme A thioesterase PaaI-like protein
VIATLLDCHMGVAATAHAHRAAGQPLGSEPLRVFVTASLHVDYLKPTPAGAELELRARVKEHHGRRIAMTCTLHVGGQETARGEAVFVEVRG